MIVMIILIVVINKIITVILIIFFWSTAIWFNQIGNDRYYSDDHKNDLDDHDNGQDLKSLSFNTQFA